MKQLSLTIIRSLSIVTLLAAGLSVSSQVNAASQCKGLENSACAGKTACSWVAGYERKDGRKVSAFCRTKAKKAASKVDGATKQQG